MFNVACKIIRKLCPLCSYSMQKMRCCYSVRAWAESSSVEFKGVRRVSCNGHESIQETAGMGEKTVDLG